MSLEELVAASPGWVSSLFILFTIYSGWRKGKSDELEKRVEAGIDIAEVMSKNVQTINALATAHADMTAKLMKRDSEIVDLNRSLSEIKSRQSQMESDVLNMESRYTKQINELSAELERTRKELATERALREKLQSQINQQSVN